MLPDWNYIKYKKIFFYFIGNHVHTLPRTQLHVFCRVSVDHTAQSRGTGPNAQVGQISEICVTWTVLLLAFCPLLASMPLQHVSWSTVPWRNAQRQWSAISCWGTKGFVKANVKWHSVRLGTDSCFILRESTVNIIYLLALSIFCTQTDTGISFLSTVTLTVLEEHSVVPRSWGGDCNGRSVLSLGRSLLTLCTSSKHLDLPHIYRKSTFCIRCHTLHCCSPSVCNQRTVT